MNSRILIFGALAMLGWGSGAVEARPIAEPIQLYEKPLPLAAGMHEQIDVGADGQRTIRNVIEPTLTPYLPSADRANGASIIVLPGGGFMGLSWDHEGVKVAQRLIEHGYTVFVLKYRLAKTPEDPAAYMAFSRARIREYLEARRKPEMNRPNPLRSAGLAAADDLSAALRTVRRRASEWGLDPQRVGALGFSAGAIAAGNSATGSGDRPDFVGLIYGALDQPVPRDAPPAFIAASVDDPLQPPSITTGIFEAWHAAGRPAELHLYSGGGHGWGMQTHGLTSDYWFQEFVWWLESRKLFAPAAKPTAAAVKPGVTTDLAGQWTLIVTLPSGVTTPKLTLHQDGEHLTGTLHSQVLGDLRMVGTYAGGIFTVAVDDGSAPLAYTGAASDRDSLSGNVTFNGVASGTFTARRE